MTATSVGQAAEPWIDASKAHVLDPATGISLTRPEHSGRT
jgi:hypothetical protein